MLYKTSLQHNSLQMKAIIGIVIAVVLLGAIAPVAYSVMQRSTVTSLKFHFNRFELTDIDFSDTSTSRSMQQVFNTLDNPSESSLLQYVSLGNQISSISSPEGFVLDMVANTKLTFSMFVDVTNPSYLEAVIDRASVKASINGRELPTALSINQQAHIPAGGQSTVELKGITLSGKEIADMLANLASNDFIMTLDFGIT